jgi:PAS domain S-box-containing protein
LTRFRTGLLCGLVALFLLLPAVAPARSGDIRLHHLSIDQGLSQGLVTSIVQDSRGFMWLGTYDGLNRYDGYDFHSYSHFSYDSRTLSHSTITCLMKDAAGTLWVGTPGGLNRYSRDSDDFSRLVNDPDNPQSLPDNYVLSLYEDRDGTFWIGTRSGLVRYNPQSGEFNRINFAEGESPIGGVDPQCFVAEDNSGRLWVGTNKGLFYYDRALGFVVRFRQTGGDPELIEDRVACIYTDGDGFLWIASASAPGRLNPETGWFETPKLSADSPATFNAPAATWIDEDGDGQLWVSTLGLGVWVYNKDRRSAVRLRHDPLNSGSLSSNAVRSVYNDRSDGVWIGTNGYGADVWYPQSHKFSLYELDTAGSADHASRSVRAIYEDKDGDLWVGGYYGLGRLDGKTGAWTRYLDHNSSTPSGLPTDNVYTICEDPLSNGTAFWIGTEGAGLAHFEIPSEAITSYPYNEENPASLAGKTIYTLWAEPSGLLWLGTEVGLSRLDPSVGRFELVFSNSAVRALQPDGGEILWVGTVESGMLRMNRRSGKISSYRHSRENASSLGCDFVLTIHKSETGQIWAGTNGGGLNRLDPLTGNFARFSEKDGLPNNVVYGILEDDIGNLWLSTNHGISRFNPGTETFQNFDVNDGLQSNEFNASAYFESGSGEMFFGGINGFNSFYPNMIKPNPHAPEVVITGLQVSNQPVPIGDGPDGRRILEKSITETSHVTLSHHDDVVTFSCAALHYALPGKNSYAYKLEGLDDNWNYIGNRRFITFTDLRPAKYRLRVKAANADGIWNETGTALVITVVPPVWGTWWFRSLAVVVFFLTLLALHRLRTHYILKRNRELDEINTKLRDHIKERTRAENELRESEEKYRVVAQSAHEGIITIDESGVISLANKSVLRIFGYSPDDLAGTNVTELIPEFPRGTKSISELMANAGTESAISFRGKHRDGDERSLELSIGEFSVKQLHLFTVIIRDVTERKRLEEQFLQVQKMDAVGRLAGGIAHDLNNLLTVIQGHGELVQMEMKGNGPVEKDIQEIMAASRRAEKLTRQLLAFGRKQLLQPRVLNVNKLIDDMGRMLSRMIGETIDIELRLEPGLGNIKADPGQIEQVIMNLVVNARDAMPDGGKITIETRELDEQKKQSRIFDHLKGGSFIQISISDTGTGMNAETQRKIFEPFFTTKATHKGTGLGLSTVYGIVKQSGGSVWVKSEEGHGAAFYVCLPRIEAAEQPVPETVSVDESANGTETILVVEDEDRVRRLVGDILRRRGYKVLETSNGIQALKVFDNEGDTIDLVLTDAVMPGMGGLEFIDRIADRLGRTRVLYMSGYSEEMVADGIAADGVAAFIHKPFTPDELTHRIRELLTLKPPGPQPT